MPSAFYLFFIKNLHFGAQTQSKICKKLTFSKKMRLGFDIFKMYDIIYLNKTKGDNKMTWFNRQSRLVQVLLLLIPFVNWLTEIIVRWSTLFKKFTVLRLLVCIIVTFFGVIIGWIDLIWVLLFKKLCLQ